MLRSTFGAFIVLAVLAVAGSAQAQSSQPSLSASLTSAAVSAASQPAATFTPTLRARFTAAQDQNASQDDQGIGVGVLGMLTWSSLNNDEGETLDYGSKTGGGFGAWIGGNRNGRVGFVGEFIYVIRKSTLGDDEVSNHVFEIPAVFHINFGSRSRNSVGGYIVVGPAFTFNLKQKVDGVELEDDNKFKGADIGIIVGAGVEFFRIGIEGRGNWGLRSITPDGDVVDTGDIRSRSIEILGKFAFN